MTTDRNSSVAQQLCTNCALCCNGVIFRDVEIGATDDSVRLKSLGLPLKTRGLKTRLAQPCAALDCSLCTIYADRPGYCRKFECALFKATVAGRDEISAALKTIRLAQKRAEKVRHLLRQLGNSDEQLALSKRFKKVSKRFETGNLAEDSTDLYADLTIAVHELNFLLSSAFYPGGES